MGSSLRLRDTLVFLTSAMQAGVPGTKVWRNVCALEKGLKKNYVSWGSIIYLLARSRVSFDHLCVSRGLDRRFSFILF